MPTSPLSPAFKLCPTSADLPNAAGSGLLDENLEADTGQWRVCLLDPSSGGAHAFRRVLFVTDDAAARCNEAVTWTAAQTTLGLPGATFTLARPDNTAAGGSAGALFVQLGSGGPASGAVPGGYSDGLVFRGGTGGAAGAGTGAAGPGAIQRIDGSGGGAGSATGRAGAGGDFRWFGGDAGADGGAGGAVGGSGAFDAGLGSGGQPNGTLGFGANQASEIIMGHAGCDTLLRGPVRLDAPTGTAAFTVAGLAAIVGVNGQVAYATNGRKIGEGVGAGTGVPVYFSGGAWRVYSIDAPVQA